MTSCYNECLTIFNCLVIVDAVDGACRTEFSRSDRFFASHGTEFAVTVVIASISKIFRAGRATKWSFTSMDPFVSLKKKSNY